MEYMLLLCTVVTVVCITGYFLKDYADVLMEKIGDKILNAVFVLALG